MPTHTIYYPFLLNRAVQKEYKENSKKLGAPYLGIIGDSTMRAVSTADESAVNRYLISLSVMSYTRYFIAPILFYTIGGVGLLLMGSVFLWLSARIGSGVLTGAYTYTITIFEEFLAVLPNFFATTGTMYEVMFKNASHFYGYLLYGTNRCAEIWMCFLACTCPNQLARR